MKIAGLHIVRKRIAGNSSRWHVYAWRGGPCIYRCDGARPVTLPADAMAAYQAACADRTKAPGDTIAGLATAWRSSAAWRAMAATTRKQWGYVLSEIETRFGTAPLAHFDDRRIRRVILKWRDAAADTPRKADYRVQVLSGLLAYGRLTGALSHNFAEGIPSLYKGGNRAAIVWTPAEIETWQNAPQQVRDAVNLARLTGLRRGDLIALPLAACGEHAIVWRTSKSGKKAIVSVPMLPELAKLIAELRARTRADGVTTLLVNSAGKPWTADGLGSSFTDARADLGLTDEKRLHDFRGTYATELCRAGITDQDAARILGWTVAQVATIRALYVDDAAVVVALGQRLANAAPVNGAVNQ